VRTDLRRDRLVPFLGIAEHRIDIEHDAAKRKQAVPHNLSDLKFGVAKLIHDDNKTTQLWRAAGDPKDAGSEPLKRVVRATKVAAYSP
jgi:hypothetical protein